MSGRGLGWPLAILAGAAMVTTACNVSINKSETVTESYDVGGFTAVEIGDGFEATIVVGDATRVELEINDELVDLVSVEVENDRLIVDLSGGLVATSGPLEARITTPALVELRASGAASVVVDDLDSRDLELDIDGASSVTATGAVTALTLDADGASSVDFDDVAVEQAIVALDGASSARLADLGQVSGSVAGASSLDVGDATIVDVETSGNSSVD